MSLDPNIYSHKICGAQVFTLALLVCLYIPDFYQFSVLLDTNVDHLNT